MNIMQFERAGPSTPSDAPASGLTTNGELPIIVRYLTILRRRKWVIIGTIVATMILGTIATLLMTPKYTASTTIEIQRETQNLAMVRGENQQAPTDLEFYQTQYGLLRARSLAERVATDLRLADKPEFFTMFKVGDAKTWFENEHLLPGAPPRATRVRKAGEVLLDALLVSPERLSRLVTISFTSPDAAFSRLVTETWAKDFVALTLERRYDSSAYARRFLEGRLTQLRAKIDESERKLVDYASQQGIVNLPGATVSNADGGTTTSAERSLLVDNLDALNRELTKATAERIVAESRRGADGGTTSEALDNQAISVMRAKRAELAADYAKLMAQFEPGYPQAMALRDQIRQLDSSIAREERRVRLTIDETYAAAGVREAELRSRVQQLKSGVLDLRRRSIEYNIIQRDADTNRQLYDALLQRYKEIGVAGGVGVNNISIVDAAETPRKPSSPKLLLNLFVALIAGTVLGVVIALAREQLDQGISDPSSIERELDVPLIGTIPQVAGGAPLASVLDRKSALAEAYMSMQTNLSFSTDHGVPKSLAITSTRAAEGKSTTSFATALSLARSGARVVLVDADMRSPSVHQMLDTTNDAGLSNYLSGQDEIASLIRQTDFANLWAITAGPQPPSAPELLSGNRISQLLAELLKQFDHVVFDAPPVMGLADAPLIASRVEGVIYVVEAHGTQLRMANVAINRLRATNASLIGVVLTKFDPSLGYYGYGYDYGYGYGYGDRAKTKA